MKPIIVENLLSKSSLSSIEAFSQKRLNLNQSFASDTITRLKPWLLLMLLVLFIAGAWYAWSGEDTWDDAFISFRYARNLADGYGLVWNPGGEPTQGYTNFLFVALIAIAIKIGVSPIVAAYLLNTLGLLLVVFTLGLLAQRLLPGHRWAWIIPPLALLFLPLVRVHMLTGMETLFWSGLVFVGVLAAQQAKQTQSSQFIYISLAVFFLGTLTRPETVIIVIPIVCYLFIRDGMRMRLHLLLAVTITGAGGLAYLFWANAYFPDFLPNSFYVKVNQSASLPGLSYVLDMIRYVATIPITYLGLLGLLFVAPNDRMHILPYTSLFSLAGFYVFVLPLMGQGYRFLFPLVCLIDFVILVGSITLIVHISQRLFQRPHVWTGLQKRLPAIVVLSLSLALLGLHFLSGSYIFWLEARSKDQPRAFANQTIMGQMLHNVEGIENVTIAFGDAGKVAYYSGAQFLDLVGLNENTIAREGNKAGADWIIQYTLKQQPDLISFYTYPDGQVVIHDHGALGTAYYDLYTSPDFQQNYSYAGGIFSHWGSYAQLFIHNQSPYADALFKTIHEQADMTELGILWSDE